MKPDSMIITMLAVIFSVLPLRAHTADAVTVTGATVTEAGIYTAQVVKEFSVSNVVSRTIQGLDGFTLVRATTNIPARIGTRFGFRYTIHGVPTNAPILLTMVGEHPPLRDPKIGNTKAKDVYQLESRIGQTYTSYSLDEEWELVPGKWKFGVWYKDQKLCEQSFVVVADMMSNDWNKIVSDNWRSVTDTNHIYQMGYAVGLKSEQPEWMSCVPMPRESSNWSRQACDAYSAGYAAGMAVAGKTRK